MNKIELLDNCAKIREAMEERVFMKYKFSIILIILFTVFISGCDNKYEERMARINSVLLDNVLKTEAAIKTPEKEAVIKTAENNCNCKRIQPFYLEIGDKNGKIISASVPNVSIYRGWTPMLIASASKWIWAAYALEKKGAAPGSDEDHYLKMLSGYTNMNDIFCTAADTVNDCFIKANTNGNNNDLSTENEDKFYYNSGNFQAYAVDKLNLGGKIGTELAAEVMSYLGTDLNLTYSMPVPAGGILMTPASYRLFLMKILKGQLQISQYLGYNAVCTQKADCPSDVAYTPVPDSESWHYSYGHWVEDDPNNGDGSFSSPGLFGFYPWINQDKTLYGIVARWDPLNGNASIESVYCGMLIRKAYIEGREQTSDCY